MLRLKEKESYLDQNEIFKFENLMYKEESFGSMSLTVS